MKTALKTMLLAGSLSALFSISSLAAQWQQNETGWWWQNDDGSYPVNQWVWLDGNGDGISESYYFDSNGYCLQNTTTPDGYIVDSNGAWTVNGVIQTQEIQAQPTQNTQMEQVQAIMPVEVDAGAYIVYLPDLKVTEEESVLYDSVVSYWVETPELIEDYIREALGNPNTLSTLTEAQRQGLIKGVLIKYPH